MGDKSGFVAGFERALLDRFPMLAQHRVPLGDWQASGDIAFEVPSPGDAKTILRVETLLDGIIVYFGGWHTHCDNWIENPAVTHREVYGDALDLIERIIENRMLVIFSEGGGSGCREDEQEQILRLWSSSGKPLSVRSWLGDMNREVEAVAPEAQDV